MNTLVRLLAFTFILFAVGCNTVKTTSVHSTTPVKQCKQLCLDKFNSCTSTCVNNCRACSLESSYNSGKNYTKYVHEQQIQGEIIARELNSYRDPLKCRKITCNCSADLNTCTQGCTGVIHKRLQTVPFCT